MNFDISSRTILLTRSGSHAYGTNTPTSDLDFKGVCIPPKSYFLGYAHHFEQSEQLVSKGHESDTTVYNIVKFFKLAQETNPNIFDVLFADVSDVIKMDQFGERLRELAPKFLSKRARYSYSGYAYSQLQRIKLHRRWLLNPPKAPPTREQFGLDGNYKFSQSEIGAFDSLINKGAEISENSLLLLNKEKQYANAKREWNQYQDWKKNRNPIRAELEAKYGFDAKHGMHLIRLSRSCEEILSGKGVIVKRPDAEELLAIRNGKWTYEQLVEEAEKIDKRCEELYQTCALPSHPDVNYLNEQCVGLVEDYLTKNG